MRHTFKRFLLSMCAAVSVASLACDNFTPQDVAEAGATFSTIESIVEALREASDNAAQALDQVTANRLEEAANRLEALLPHLREVMDGAERNAHSVIDNAANETAGVLSNLRLDLQKIGGYATAAANGYVAEASSLLDALPFVNVPPSVFAITPSVLDAAVAEQVVRISGYLPGAPGTDIHLTVMGRDVPLTRAAGRSLTFALSGAAARPGTAIPLQLRIRERKGPFGLFSRWQTFAEVLRYGATTPLTCVLDTHAENPQYLRQVMSTASYSVEASTQGGVNRANERRLLLAADLFQSTVGDSAHLYDLGSVSVAALGAVFVARGGGCGAGPGANWEIQKGGTQALITVHAPHLKRRYERHGVRIRICDQGGTKGTVTLRPVYRAALKATPFLRKVRSETITMGMPGASREHGFGDKQPWAYHVSCTYKDGPESWQSSVAVLNSLNRSAIVRGLSARVAEDRLILEPIAPIQFSDAR
jgi:hypothetical protein